MITPEEAQKRAQQLVEQYVADAGPEDMHDAANLLMKLASVVGLTLVQAAGHKEAVARMQGTVDYITRFPNGRAPLATPPRTGMH